VPVVPVVVPEKGIGSSMKVPVKTNLSFSKDP
jgi:hypothetical protein